MPGCTRWPAAPAGTGSGEPVGIGASSLSSRGPPNHSRTTGSGSSSPAATLLLANEGYLPPTADPARDLIDDAKFLANLLHRLMPAEPEVLGVVALIRLHRARYPASFDARGDIVQRHDQDRTLCNRQAIADDGRLIAGAAALKRPGPYQRQAAIVARRAEADGWDDTSWTQILVLYDNLLHLAPSPVTRLHRAVAFRYVAGRTAALDEVDTLVQDLDGYHLLHAARAELTANPAEQSILRRRLNRD